MRAFVRWLIVAAVTASGSTSLNAQGITFRNTEFKFRFVYPSDWKLVKPRGPNVRALIQGPDKMGANCNILVKRAPELAKFTKKQIIEEMFSTVWSEDDWKEMLSDFSKNVIIRERRLTKASNYPVQFVVYDTPYETVGTKFYAAMAQFVAMTPGLFWQFGCTAGAPNLMEARRNFDAMRPQFLQVLSSFVFEEGFY